MMRLVASERNLQTTLPLLAAGLAPRAHVACTWKVHVTRRRASSEGR